MYNLVNNRRNFERSLWDEFFTPTVTGLTASMRTDVTETEDNYLFDMELPGYVPADVKVSLESGYLKVEAVKNNENNDEGKRFIRKERYYGSLTRSFYVGDVDKNSVKANFKNGILTITIPKQQQEKPDNNIQINID